MHVSLTMKEVEATSYTDQVTRFDKGKSNITTTGDNICAKQDRRSAVTCYQDPPVRLPYAKDAVDGLPPLLSVGIPFEAPTTRLTHTLRGHT